jgi:hypothetical protein
MASAARMERGEYDFAIHESRFFRFIRLFLGYQRNFSLAEARKRKEEN